MAFNLFKRISPEYVVKNAIEDIKQFGLDGLKPYLTAEATKKIDMVQTFSSGVELFTGGILPLAAASGTGTNAENPLKVLLGSLKECDWTVKDVLNGSETSKAIIGFKYKDNLEGTVELSMIKEDKEWKIDNLNMPKFDKVELSKESN